MRGHNQRLYIWWRSHSPLEWFEQSVDHSGSIICASGSHTLLSIHLSLCWGILMHTDKHNSWLINCQWSVLWKQLNNPVLIKSRQVMILTAILNEQHRSYLAYHCALICRSLACNSHTVSVWGGHTREHRHKYPCFWSQSRPRLAVIFLTEKGLNPPQIHSVTVSHSTVANIVCQPRSLCCWLV